MDEPKFFFAKLHQDMWFLSFRIFGGDDDSNDLGTSKMYIDSYGIVYMAGKSSAWCSQYEHQPNAWTIFKNNF